MIQTKLGLMLGIQTVGAVSSNSQIFYFPIKLWVQMPGAAKLQKYECAVCFKTQIMDPLRNLNLTGNLALVPITQTHATFTFMFY